MENSNSSQLSHVSVSSSNNSLHDICRFCLCEGLPDSPLISPCCCIGSLRYVHQSCLQQWIKSSDARSCELCKFQFILHIKTEPFRKWKKLELSPVEKRDLRSNIFILIITITYCGGKLYQMIKGTNNTVQVDWWRSFIEFIIDAFLSLGMFIFMCLSLISLMLMFWKWKIFNSTIYVQDAPEEKNASDVASGNSQMQLQQADLFTTESNNTTLSRELTEQFLMDDNVIQGFHNGNNSISNSHSNNRIDVDETENTSNEIPFAEVDSKKLMVTSLVDKRMVHMSYPLSQVLVVSNFDAISNTDKAIYFSTGVSNV